MTKVAKLSQINNVCAHRVQVPQCSHFIRQTTAHRWMDNPKGWCAFHAHTVDTSTDIDNLKKS